MAAPKVGSLALGAQFSGAGEGRANRWTTQCTMNESGLASADAAVSLRGGVDGNVALGVGWSSRRVGTLILMAGKGSWASGIRIPWVQPAFQPFRPLLWCSWSGGVTEGRIGAVRLDWHAGSLPSIRCSFRANGWEFGWGSRGGWLSYQMGKGDVGWQVLLGVSRGDVPWLGLDSGPVTQRASRDLHARLDALGEPQKRR